MRILALALLLLSAGCAGSEVPPAACWCPEPGAGCWALWRAAEAARHSVPETDLGGREEQARQAAGIWRLGLVPWQRALGLTVVPLSPEDAVTLGIAPAHGFQVTHVEELSPELSGLRDGDAVLRMNNLNVSAAGAPYICLRRGPLSLEVLRPGQGRLLVPVVVTRERTEPAATVAPDVQEMLRRAVREAMGNDAVIPLAGRRDGGG